MSIHIEPVSVCESKGVGHLGTLLSQNPRRKHVDSFGIAVHPDFQGKGVGKALMEELIRLSDNWLNWLRIELDVFSDNEVAVALYKTFDFVIDGDPNTITSNREKTAIHINKWHGSIGNTTMASAAAVGGRLDAKR